MMKVDNIIFVIVTLCILNIIQFAYCFIPLIPVAVAGIVGLASWGGYHASKCRYQECCSNEYIPADFDTLDSLLKYKVYGQHLAYKTVLNALKGHFKVQESKKALAMSFHGLPGSGKNYVADFIAETLYKHGLKSKYVHFYSGRLDFRLAGNVNEYQQKIKEEVINHLKLCPRSLFIFDEVEKIPEGTLNVLVPFLDYHPKIPDVDPTQAIYIFLSNSGGPSIVKEMIQMWQAGKKREDTELSDFETRLAISAFNEEGGFRKSDTIETSLIDHYIPFLPLEESHVKNCIINAYRRRSINPSSEWIAEAMEFVTFGPPPHNLYSNAGCKRLDAKVSAIIESHHMDTKTP